MPTVAESFRVPSQDTLLADLNLDSLDLIELHFVIEKQSGGKVSFEPDDEDASFDLSDSLKTIVDTTMRCAVN